MHRSQKKIYPGLFFLAVVCLLASCGFKAAYHQDFATYPQLALIEIAAIESVEGAELCYHLAKLLPASPAPRYLLTITLSHTTSPLILQKNADTLREIINQQVTYQLIDKQTKQLMTSGHFVNISSYSTITSPYAAYVQSETTIINSSKQAAEEIRSRLILYLTSKTR